MNSAGQSSSAEKRSVKNELILDIRDRKKYRKETVSFIFKILLVFSFALLVLVRYASITEIGHKINQEQKVLETAEAENRRLNKELASYTNLSVLKTAAEEKFGMQRPEESQKVYIDSPSCDRTELYNTQLTEDKNETDLKQTLIEKIRRFVGFV